MISFNDFAKDFGNKSLVYKLQKFLEYQENTIKFKDARIAELNIKCDEKNALLIKTSCEVHDLYGLSVKRKERIAELETHLKLSDKIRKCHICGNEAVRSSFLKYLDRITELEAENKEISKSLLNNWAVSIKGQGEYIKTLESSCLILHESSTTDEIELLIKEIKEKHETKI